MALLAARLLVLICLDTLRHANFRVDVLVCLSKNTVKYGTNKTDEKAKTILLKIFNRRRASPYIRDYV